MSRKREGGWTKVAAATIAACGVLGFAYGYQNLQVHADSLPYGCDPGRLAGDFGPYPNLTPSGKVDESGKLYTDDPGTLGLSSTNH
ncbi:MAG TPA: hypothetical protein V6C81_23940 [Planktothrix sp.]